MINWRVWLLFALLVSALQVAVDTWMNSGVGVRDRDLSLDFPKAQKGRVRTVLDCLAHFTHKETVEMRCEKCGKLCDFEKRLRVKRRPPVLVRTPTTVIKFSNCVQTWSRS